MCGSLQRNQWQQPAPGVPPVKDERRRPLWSTDVDLKIPSVMQAQ